MKYEDYHKLRTALRYWMLGRNYHLAHKAMEFGLVHHTGLRKDGVSPEFQHQISQASYARTMEHSLMFPDETLATIFLHDIVEDTDVTASTIYAEFGEQVGVAVEGMTNLVDGVKKLKEVYYGPGMSDNPITSVAKGTDRIHNHQTMVGVFTPAKIDEYMVETYDFVLPMLKRARKIHTLQEPVYLNIKHVLLTQMELLQVLNPVKSKLRLEK